MTLKTRSQIRSKIDQLQADLWSETNDSSKYHSLMNKINQSVKQERLKLCTIKEKKLSKVIESEKNTMYSSPNNSVHTACNTNTIDSSHVTNTKSPRSIDMSNGSFVDNLQGTSVTCNSSVSSLPEVTDFTANNGSVQMYRK